jgi:hypothetical protein
MPDVQCATVYRLRGSADKKAGKNFKRLQRHYNEKGEISAIPIQGAMNNWYQIPDGKMVFLDYF